MNQEKIIIATLTEYFAQIEAMNAEKWRSLFTPDGVSYDPIGNPGNHVCEYADKFFALLSGAFSTIKIAADNIFIVGNHAAVKWTMEVVAKNNRCGKAQGISTFVFAETGKIEVVSSYWDDRGLMKQIKD